MTHDDPKLRVGVACLGRFARAVVARIVLALSYSIAFIIAWFGRRRPVRSWPSTGRILATGTFHNPNWFIAHAVPLTRSGAGEIIFVVDEVQPTVAGVRFVCPPRWLPTLAGRALSKLLWMIVVSLRDRPDLYMGYHLFPGALSALIVARLFGRPACYQMTGGPIEIAGGGFENENPLMQGLGKPSPRLERLAVAVVRRFDLIVVRGSKARCFLADRGAGDQVAIIPGSTTQPRRTADDERPYDLLYVGRLSGIKQPGQVIEITAVLRHGHPSIRTVMAGDGPLWSQLRERAASRGVARNTEFVGKLADVGPILFRSKVFVLTSRSEGLSIAMAEAMAAGVVPVVADVGELGDLVRNGENGYLVPPNDIGAYAERISALLADPVLWSRLSQAAREAAYKYNGVDAVSQRWARSLQPWMSAGSAPVEGVPRPGVPV